MMDTRREFIKKAALLAGSTGFFNGLPDSIQKALAIAPAPGTTYQDAEHVVILMQENRSFDHCYGRLRGVRGFNDPRTLTLPNQNRVWLQTNQAGETYAPFRLNLRDTKATWMSSLPHSWTNQVDARNNGKYDRWLDVKHSGNRAYAHMPLTLGYYDRQDIPFYYALADAFTVCDQNFCSSLTGTTPNRLYFWSGTIREDATSNARVRNEELDYHRPASWTTFPERLEKSGISWRIYQNEINLSTGFEGEEDAWLANFSDNPLEWFSQYNVRFSATYQAYRQERLKALPAEISDLERKTASVPDTTPDGKTLRKALQQKKDLLTLLTDEGDRWQPDQFGKLTAHEQALHQRAFTTNTGDPDYRQLTSLHYDDAGQKRDVAIPKGDVLHQFRTDVQNGQLPTVSWLVAPENFSDHPGAPWYGAWYLSEVLDILTHNPAIWQKTIFILAYDENDGYFDHVPPFVPPHPDQPETGKVSPGIDTLPEHVSLAHELRRPVADPSRDARSSPIGLGYRVPLVIASPWSRGGYVCSEVFDHTSTLQFLEHWLSKKNRQPIQETNISTWRRAICGNLTSAFRPYQGETIALPDFVARDTFIEGIHKAKFKDVPANFRPLSKADIDQANQQPATSPVLPRQEPGNRPACALPYELIADGQLEKGRLRLTLAAKKNRFGSVSAGAPFMVYNMADHSVRNYAVLPGHELTDDWALASHPDYHVQLYGPNGFFRVFKGAATSAPVAVQCSDHVTNQQQAELVLHLQNPAKKSVTVTVQPNAYGYAPQQHVLGAAGSKTAKKTVTLPLADSFGWYDVSVQLAGQPAFEQRYAGRVETGASSFSDPLLSGE